MFIDNNKMYNNFKKNTNNNQTTQHYLFGKEN